MKLHHLARTMFSGAVFYVVAAACGSDHAVLTQDGGLADAIANPEKEASAAPSDTAVEACDKTGSFTAAGTTHPYLFAVHSYPGRSAAELAGVRALGHTAANQPLYTVGATVFALAQYAALVSDGQVAVQCGEASSLAIDSVTFVGP